MKRLLFISLTLFIMGVSGTLAQDPIPYTDIVTAEGDGRIALNGAGEITIEGRGMLFIVDRTGTATIDVTSQRRTRLQEQQMRGNAVYIYRNFNGTATIIGDDIAIVMDGVIDNIAINCSGMMLIEGEGEYQLNEQQYVWATEGILLTLGEPAP